MLGCPTCTNFTKITCVWLCAPPFLRHKSLPHFYKITHIPSFPLSSHAIHTLFLLLRTLVPIPPYCPTPSSPFSVFFTQYFWTGPTIYKSWPVQLHSASAQKRFIGPLNNFSQPIRKSRKPFPLYQKKKGTP